MQENPKPPSPLRRRAHVTGYRSFTAAGISLAGATATSQAANAGHTVFAVGAVSSLVAMVTAMALHGSDMLQCSHCMGQVARSLQEQHALDCQASLEPAEPLPAPAELWPPTSGVVPPEFRWAFS